MDKILSAEEWIQKNGFIGRYTDLMNGYSTYLLEAFAGEVKKENNRYILENESIDQLLIKFKEKL